MNWLERLLPLMALTFGFEMFGYVVEFVGFAGSVELSDESIAFVEYFVELTLHYSCFGWSVFVVVSLIK